MSRAPMRIVHVVQSLGYGGMENRIMRLARGLDPAAFTVELITLRKAAAGQMELPPGIRHRHVPVPPGLHPLALLRLALAIRRGRYDIVHTHNWSSMFYGVLAAALARRPLIVHGEHGLNRGDLQGTSGKRLRAQRLLARLASALVPVNAVIADHLRAHWRVPEKLLTVISNGVDLKRFGPGREAPPEGFVMGMVGRLDEVKDLSCALRALALLRSKHGVTEARLVLVGDGPLAGSLAAEAAALGVAEAVEFAGGRKDVERWYGRFTVYLNTSVYEGMSNTLLEAMASGLPLAVSRVPGNAAWLREGADALFFEPGDAEGLARRLLELRSDAAEREAMGRRNRARVEADFDNEKFLEIYAGLYRRLLPSA